MSHATVARVADATGEREGPTPDPEQDNGVVADATPERRVKDLTPELEEPVFGAEVDGLGVKDLTPHAVRHEMPTNGGRRARGGTPSASRKTAGVGLGARGHPQTLGFPGG